MTNYTGVEHLENILDQNPDLLEDYVLKRVETEQLERWLLRKTQMNHKRRSSMARTKVLVDLFGIMITSLVNC